jgi:hypothetical protein
LNIPLGKERLLWFTLGFSGINRSISWSARKFELIGDDVADVETERPEMRHGEPFPFQDLTR